jgi:RND family efflux transporter MFP subunit
MTSERKTIDDLRIDRPRHAPRTAPVGLAVVALALAIAGGAAYWWFTRPGAVVVRTAVAQAAAAGQDRTLLNASGYVTARLASTVASKVTGKVVEVLVEEGMKVQANQVLAKLDASNVEKGLNLANAQLEAAQKALGETQANLEQAERELKRVTALWDERVATRNEFDTADAIAKALRARLLRQQSEVIVAEKEVAQQMQNMDDMIIRAPFAGVVISKDAQPGEIISPMSAGGGFTRTGICTIVDMASLEIEVDVNESYINRVEASQPVIATLDSYPQWKIPAKVIAIIPTADRQKATVKVRVGFENLDPRILPDMSVKVAFQQAAGSGDSDAGAPRGTVIPGSAIRQREGKDIVWLVRDSQIERRAVTIGATNGKNVTIVAGVDAGERVVVDPPAELADGARVTEADQ